MIRGAVREAGDRAKVAVYSRERDVDPVGACVGMKGTRVQAIIRELRGEKIDIVEWSEDPVQFVMNGLSPAKVQRVTIVDDKRQGDGSRRRGQAVVAGDRQEGPERPPGRQADRLAHRHQERGREAQGSRSGVRRDRSRRGRGAARRGAADRRLSPPRQAGQPSDSRSRPTRSAEAAPAETPRSTRAGRSRGRRPSTGEAATDAARSRSLASTLSATAAESARSPENAIPNGNSPDLQSRRASEHDQPGSAGPAQEEPRHRAEERVEHARRDRGSPVRRAPGASSAASSCRRATSSRRRPRSRSRARPAGPASRRGSGRAAQARGRRRWGRRAW